MAHGAMSGLISQRLAAMAAAVVLIAGLVGVVGACGSDMATSIPADNAASADSAAETPVGAGPLAAVSGTTVSGSQLSLGDLAGQDMVLWFWAPW